MQYENRARNRLLKSSRTEALQPIEPLISCGAFDRTDLNVGGIWCAIRAALAIREQAVPYGVNAVLSFTLE